MRQVCHVAHAHKNIIGQNDDRAVYPRLTLTRSIDHHEIKHTYTLVTCSSGERCTCCLRRRLRRLYNTDTNTGADTNTDTDTSINTRTDTNTNTNTNTDTNTNTNTNTNVSIYWRRYIFRTNFPVITIRRLFGLCHDSG